MFGNETDSFDADIHTVSLGSSTGYEEIPEYVTTLYGQDSYFVHIMDKEKGEPDWGEPLFGAKKLFPIIQFTNQA